MPGTAAAASQAAFAPTTALSTQSALSIVAVAVPASLLLLCCGCIGLAFRFLSRASPGLLPDWARRVFQSRVYQEVRWQLTNWGLADVRTSMLLTLAQLVAGLICYLIEPPSTTSAPTPAVDASLTTNHTAARSLSRATRRDAPPPTYIMRHLASHTDTTAVSRERSSAIVLIILLVVAQWAFIRCGHAVDNRFDMIASAALAAALAALLAAIAVRAHTAATLAAACSIGGLALLGVFVTLRLLTTMGFQSFLRLGGDVRHRKLYSCLLCLYTLLKLDLLGSALTLLFWSASWTANGWDDTPSNVACVATLAAACLGSVLSYIAASVGPSPHRLLPTSLLLVVVGTIGAGAAFTVVGVTAAPQPPPDVPVLALPYWYTLLTAWQSVRLGLLACCIIVWWQRGSVCAIRSKGLPAELESLPPQQKAALNKIAHGEVCSACIIKA